MQEPQIGWLPEHRPQPWELTFLVLYLLAIFGLCVAKLVRLGEQLWWFRPRSQNSLQTSEDSKKACLLAASALADRRWSRQPDPSLSLRQLNLAENEFRYRWEMCSVEAASLKRLVGLTLLLSAFASLSLMVKVPGKVSSHNPYPLAAYAWGVGEALVPFAIGVFVCALLYSASSLFEGVLARRRASWNYFCARVKDQAPTAPNDRGNLPAPS